LHPLIDKVWRHCQSSGGRGHTVTLKVKYADFELITRSRSNSGAVASRDELERDAVDLLRKLMPMPKAVGLLGVSASGFTDESEGSAPQMAHAL
jgi:DNA polymerase-4